MNDQTQYDPWEAAEEAKELPRHYFGRVTFDVWACTLVKGVGKIPFDTNAHKPEQRRTAIDIVIAPLPSSSVTFETERHVIAESKEWAGQTLPSIKALGVQIKDLHEKHVKYELVPTGKTYTNDNGEEKVLTYINFLAVYKTEEEAEAAASALYGGGNGDSEPAPVSTGDPEKDAALQFLPSLVASVNGDREKVEMMIANTPLIKKHFEIDSPEVVALLTPEPGKVLEEEEIPF